MNYEKLTQKFVDKKRRIKSLIIDIIIDIIIHGFHESKEIKKQKKKRYTFHILHSSVKTLLRVSRLGQTLRC